MGTKMWLSRLIFVSINAILLVSSLSIDPTLVTLPKGKIRGHVLKTVKDNTYYAFQEIPYAAPPVGPLRFAEPVEPESWNGVLDTIQNTKICYQQAPQTSFITKNVTQTEDCLYLNVYTPVAPGTPNELLPVAFHLHGGSFLFWDGSFQRNGPQYFIDKKVVVVTLNSRLGPFGLLNTNDGVIPGNIALKDQNLALRWTNQNIALFGGDPKKVTLIGEMSGGTAAGFHIVSEKSAGLFRGAILESLSCICDYAYQPHGTHFAYQVGQIVDASLSTSNTTRELLEVLRSASAEELNSATPNVPDEYINELLLGGAGVTWGPTIESSDNPNAYITRSTYEDLESGNFNRVPLLAGFNSEESLFLYSVFANVSGASIDNDLVWAVGRNLNLNSTSIEKAGKAIRSIYTNTTFEEDYPALVRLTSEKVFDSCLTKHAEIQSRFADVFLYQFSYSGPMAEIKQYVSLVAGEEMGTVAHNEETSYLWSRKGWSDDHSKFPKSDVLTADRLSTIWSNFIKHLNPTPDKDELLKNIEWPKFESKNLRYVNISESLDIRENPKNFARWREIIDTYGVRPFITY